MSAEYATANLRVYQVRVHGCGEGAGGRIAGKVLQHTEGWGSGRRERGEFSHRRDEAALSAVDLRNQILRIAEFSDFGTVDSASEF